MPKRLPWLALAGLALMALLLGLWWRNHMTKPEPPPPEGNPALPADFVPSGVAFWDEQHGLMAGQASCQKTCSGIIAATSDSGRTWQVVYQGGSQLTALTAAASTSAWAVAVTCADDGSACEPILLRTRDGGKTWSSLPQAVASPAFADAMTGWALPSEAGRGWNPKEAPIMLTTGDGGETWQPITSPCSARAGTGAAAVHLVAPGQGWVACAGQPGAGQQRKAVYGTADGGMNWHTAADPGGGGYLASIFFQPDGRGWLLERRGSLLFTPDGGKSWSPAPVTEPERREAYSISFPTDRTGYLLLRENDRREWQLLKTEDGGQHWQNLRAWPIDR